jgi:hypothetical protein
VQLLPGYAGAFCRAISCLALTANIRRVNIAPVCGIDTIQHGNRTMNRQTSRQSMGMTTLCARPAGLLLGGNTCIDYDYNQPMVRMDYNLTDKTKLYSYFLYWKGTENRTQNGLTGVPANGNIDYTHQNWVATQDVTHTFSSTMVGRRTGTRRFLLRIRRCALPTSSSDPHRACSCW